MIASARFWAEGEATTPLLLTLLLSFGPAILIAGLFFYLLTNDKRVSPWEGWLFVILYVLFVVQLVIA